MAQPSHERARTVEMRIVDAIVAAAEGAGLDVTGRDDYSGRGMYGAKTGAIIGPLNEIMAAAILATINPEPVEAEDLAESIRRSSRDSMGRDDVVIY